MDHCNLAAAFRHVACALVLVARPSTAPATSPSILSLTPVGSQSCIAVGIESGGELPLLGFEFLNNDGSTAFPYVVLMEGLPGEPPNLADAAMLLGQVSGESLAWGSATLEQAVVSSTGLIYAVFVLPAQSELSGKGEGGGPGIGIEPDEAGLEAPVVWLSSDGIQWLQHDPGMRLAFTPQYGSGKMEAVTLASLQGSVALDLFQLPAEANEETPVRATALLAPRPNPFNPRTEILYELAAPTRVHLRIYNLRGQLVRDLVDEPMPAGRHRALWQGNDSRGHAVASGTYIVTREAGGRSFRQKLTLLR
jgi:hypothetical protein